MMLKLHNNKKNLLSLIILQFNPNRHSQGNNQDKREREVSKLINKIKKLKHQKQGLKKSMLKNM